MRTALLDRPGRRGDVPRGRWGSGEGRLGGAGPVASECGRDPGRAGRRALFPTRRRRGGRRGARRRRPPALLLPPGPPPSPPPPALLLPRRRSLSPPPRRRRDRWVDVVGLGFRRRAPAGGRTRVRRRQEAGFWRGPSDPMAGGPPPHSPSPPLPPSSTHTRTHTRKN